MTAVKTDIGAHDVARNVLIQRIAGLNALETEAALRELAALVGVAGAPATAEYITGSTNATLSAERVATDTATIDVDLATAGQAKWNIIADSVDNTFLANMAQATIKGRASGAGTGDPTDLSATQTKTVLGLPTSSTDNTVPRFDGTGGNLQTSGVTIGDTDIVGGVAAIGVGGATGDTTNRISSNSPAVLFNHAGTTSQVKINKAATGDTASHLFQVGFSGRAEFGLIGSNDFQMKTSPDGSAFTTGLSILATDAAVRVHVNVSPNANDGAALGTTALGWADLHLASGAVVNYANGNLTETHSSGLITTAGRRTITYTGADGSIPLTIDASASSIDASPGFTVTMPATGAQKAFQCGISGGIAAFASFEFNVGGSGKPGLALGPASGTRDVNIYRDAADVLKTDDSLIVSGTLTASGTLELGNASDTTLSRSAAGVIAVEGVPIYSNIPQNSQSAAYTTVLADAQKHILHPTADNNARTFTIAANASVAYPIGTAITFVNQINTVTIAINSDTLVLAGTGATGSRTLAANGMATALKIASTTWMVSGTGLT
jgi:hypothetical protein